MIGKVYVAAFTTHPKKAPGSGELVTMGIDGQKPYWMIGVISAEEKLLHKADLNSNRSVLSHEMGVTQNYNVLIDHPLIVDLARIVRGGQLIEYDKEGNSRIGVNRVVNKTLKQTEEFK